MSLKPEYDGDALKAAGALLAISKNKTTDEVNGLYVLSKEGTFIRGDGMWHTATGLALHQLNGSKLIPMLPDFIDTFDAIDVKGTVPTAQEIEAGRTKGKPDSRDTQQTNITAAKAKQATKAAKAAKTDKTKKAKKAGKCPVSDTGGVSQTTVRRAWHLASRIVASRPWLEICGVGQYDVPSHLVVHDGPYGAALHFADDEGPTWEPRSAPEQDLHWEDVEDVDAVNPTGAVDWVERWGPPAPSTKLTPKAAIYTLIAHLLDTDSTGERWDVRPAPLLHYTDESADAPDSAFSLTEDFDSLASTVQFYVDQITSPSWGEGTVWHEPLWLVTRDDEPRLVLDEAGQVHLTYESLSETLRAMSAAMSLGGIEDIHSFDLMDALPRVTGDFDKLAALLRDGPGQTLDAVKPNRRLTTEGSEDAPATEVPREETPRDSWVTRREETPVTWESKVRGLLLGLALGDASIADLTATQPPRILRAGAATQMAAWTADAMLRCATRYGIAMAGGGALTTFVGYGYRRWAALRGLQLPPGQAEDHGGWLIEVPAMAEVRGRSSSMDQAMQTGRPTDRDTCRPMLRALPVAALAGTDRFTHLDASGAGALAREIAEITHQNPAVGNAAYMAARIAVHCLRGHGSFTDACPVTDFLLPIIPTIHVLLTAHTGASEHPAKPEFLRQIAPNDTAASVLAGAVYTAYSFPVWKSAADAIEFARLAPDGDGVAGLVGAFLGALHGYEVFPTAQLARLELGWVMDRLAIDIALEVKDNLLPPGGVKEGAEPWLDPWWKVKYPQG